jgi:hypothetical protein
LRDGRGGGEDRELSDQALQYPGGLGRPDAAAGARRGEQRLLAAGGVGQDSRQVADLLPDLDGTGVPGGGRERRGSVASDSSDCWRAR